VTLTLPYPPSANLYWRNAHGRTHVSTSAKEYKKSVQTLCLLHRVQPLHGRLKVTIHLWRPRKAGDLDNRIKILIDALQGAAYANDKQIVELHAYRHEDKRNPRADVEIFEREYE